MDLDPLPSLLGRERAEPAASAGNGGSEGADRGADADFDSFLRLLTAQMRNQDPLKPMDSTEFVAQLASFSTVEQIIGTNERLDDLLASAGADGASGLADWIGRQAAGVDGRFLATGEPRNFPLPEVAGATRVEAVLRGADGTERHRFDVIGNAGGLGTWDGRDSEDRVVGAGTPLTLELVYHSGEEIVARKPGGVLDTVTGLTAGDDGPSLLLSDGRALKPGQVSAIISPSEQSSPQNSEAG